MTRHFVLNPADDSAFAAFATALAKGIDTPAGLAEALRPRYPRVAIHPRLISGGPETWYVYRDGRWVARNALDPK